MLYSTEQLNPNNGNLELQLHASDILSWFNSHQLLDVSVQTSSRNFWVTGHDSFQQCIMDEYVLVFSLNLGTARWLINECTWEYFCMQSTVPKEYINDFLQFQEYTKYSNG